MNKQSLVTILVLSFILCACAPITRGPDYVPVISASQVTDLTDVAVVELPKLYKIFISAPQFVDDGSPSVISSSPQVSAIGTLITGIADSVVDARSKRSYGSIRQAYQLADQCINQSFVQLEQTQNFSNPDLAQQIGWSDSIYHRQVVGRSVDIYVTYPNVKSYYQVAYIVRMANDFSTLNVEMRVSHYKKGHRDIEAEKQLIKNPHLAPRGVKLLASRVDSFNINYQMNAGNPKTETNYFRDDCDLSNFATALGDRRMDNIRFWMESEGLALNEGLTASKAAFSHVFGIRVNDLRSELNTAPQYPPLEFRAYSSSDKESKANTIMLRARTLASFGELKVVQKYEGTYFIFPQNALPYVLFTY